MPEHVVAMQHAPQFLPCRSFDSRARCRTQRFITSQWAHRFTSQTPIVDAHAIFHTQVRATAKSLALSSPATSSNQANILNIVSTLASLFSATADKMTKQESNWPRNLNQRKDWRSGLTAWTTQRPLCPVAVLFVAIVNSHCQRMQPKGQSLQSNLTWSEHIQKLIAESAKSPG